MIKNYVFDLGMVLFNYDTEYMTKKYIHNLKDSHLLENAIFSRRYWDMLDKGAITDDELKAAVHSEIPKRLYDVADTIYDNWINNLLPIDGMEEIIHHIKNIGAKLFLLSNISVGFAEKYSTVPHVNAILSCFDGLVFSGPIHMVKPKNEIFNYLIDYYSLHADECLFIDDNANNIATAKRLGFHTYRFDGDVTKFREYLVCKSQ